MRSFLLVLLLTLLPARGDAFDYYVMALSWTPSWCERDGDARRAAACAPGAEVGWSVHGLWPQYDSGDWPEYCTTEHPAPKRSTTAAMADIMGSGGAAYHQWNKHGRCSGLSAEGYFGLTRAIFARLALPEPSAGPGRDVDSVTAAVLAANPWISPDALVLTCARGMLAEVRLCLTRDLAPRPCDAGLRARACRAEQLRIPRKR